MHPRIAVGLFALMATGLCNAQLGPFLEADLMYAAHVCTDTSYAANAAQSIGLAADLNASNRGCLAANEHGGVWMHFKIATPGQVAFTISVAPMTDYDFGVWGPFTAPLDTLTSAPVRCSWSGVAGAGGLDYVAVDLTEGAGGNGWVRYMDVLAGEWYVLYVDNFTMNGVGFDLTWQFQEGASLECLGGPEAEFTVSDDLITAGGSASFTDESTNYPYAWYWEFPGGLPATSLDQNPQDIVYSTPGCYNVSLTAYNAAGDDSGTTTCLVNVEASTSIEAQRPASYNITQVNDAIQIRPLSATAIYQLRLTDATGRMVKNISTRGATEINTHDLRAGSYSVVLDDGAHHVVQRMVIVH